MLKRVFDYHYQQIGNIFIVDKFLGGAFLTYGSDVVKFSNMNQENRSDPMIEVSTININLIRH